MKYKVKSWEQLGDSVILTGAVHNVKAEFPEIEFVYSGFPQYREIYKHNPDFSSSADGCINLGYIGYGEGEEKALRGNHVEAQTMTLCEKMKIPYVPYKTRVPILRLTEEEIESGRKYQNKWLVNANCQQYSISKYYPHWQEVIDGMLDIGLNIIQIGGNEARDITTNLSGVEDMRGKTTVRELMAMVYNCSGIVSPSSGIVHIGAAWEKPTVCLIGARENPGTLYQHCKYIETECDYKYCISHTAEQCRCYNDGCPCMDFPSNKVINAILDYMNA